MTKNNTKKINWEPIHDNYVQGITQKDKTKQFPTHNQLSQKYNVPLGTIKNKASEEKWTEQRKRYKLKVKQKLLEKKGHKSVLDDPVEEDEAAEIDAETIIQSDAKFEKTGEALRELVDKKINLELQEPGMVNPYHLKMMGDALKSAQDVVKVSQGEMLGNANLTIENRFEVTKRILGTNEFVGYEVGLLHAISKKQSGSK